MQLGPYGLLYRVQRAPWIDLIAVGSFPGYSRSKVTFGGLATMYLHFAVLHHCLFSLQTLWTGWPKKGSRLRLSHLHTHSE